MRDPNAAPRISEAERTIARRSLLRDAARARQAFVHLDAALGLILTLDDTIYYDLAAGACDVADNVRACLGRQADEHDLTAEIVIDDSCLALHRTAVMANVSPQRPGSASASSSCFDMVSFAERLMPSVRPGSR